MSKTNAFIIVKSLNIYTHCWLYTFQKQNEIKLVINKNKISSLSFNNGIEKLMDVFEASDYINNDPILSKKINVYNVLLLEYYSDLKNNLIH